MIFSKEPGYEYQVRIDRSFVRFGFDVWLARIRIEPVKIEYLQPDGSWLQVPEGSLMPTPSFTWNSAILKAFGLALGESGLVHQDLVFNSKELKATQFHLEDMRKLVFEAQK